MSSCSLWAAITVKWFRYKLQHCSLLMTIMFMIGLLYIYLLKGIVEEEDLPSCSGQPLAATFQQALSRYVFPNHVFYMMTTGRALLKKFWGREESAERWCLSLFTSFRPYALQHQADNQNLYVRLGWCWCCYCYRSSAVSDKIPFLTLTLLCLRRSIWWLMWTRWNFHCYQPPVSVRPRGGKSMYTLTRSSGRSLTQTTLKLNSGKKNREGLGGVSSFPPPPPWLLVVYHAVAKWWRGHAPCLMPEIVPVASLLTWIPPTIVWGHHSRSHQFRRFGWKPNHQSPWSVKLWLGTCSWILQPCCRCEREQNVRQRQRCKKERVGRGV